MATKKRVCYSLDEGELKLLEDFRQNQGSESQADAMRQLLFFLRVCLVQADLGFTEIIFLNPSTGEGSHILDPKISFSPDEKT